MATIGGSQNFKNDIKAENGLNLFRLGLNHGVGDVPLELDEEYEAELCSVLRAMKLIKMNWPKVISRMNSYSSLSQIMPGNHTNFQCLALTIPVNDNRKS
jgi:hypothetical protein